MLSSLYDAPYKDISPSVLDGISSQLDRLYRITNDITPKRVIVNNITASPDLVDSSKIQKHRHKTYITDHDKDFDYLMNTSNDDIKKAITKYYYKKITTKWLKKDKRYNKLLRFIKIDGDKCDISGKNNDELPADREKAKKIIEKKIECFNNNFIDKYDISNILTKLKDKQGVSWHTLNKESNKSYIKKYIYKQLKKKLQKRI